MPCQCAESITDRVRLGQPASGRMSPCWLHDVMTAVVQVCISRCGTSSANQAKTLLCTIMPSIVSSKLKSITSEDCAMDVALPYMQNKFPTENFTCNALLIQVASKALLQRLSQCAIAYRRLSEVHWLMNSADDVFLQIEIDYKGECTAGDTIDSLGGELHDAEPCEGEGRR